VNGLFEDLVR